MTAITIMIALVSLLLMAAVLIQNPKGGGVDSTFGGTQANQMFGAAKSADFIEKITWYLAIALFILCIVSTFFTGGNGAEQTIIEGGLGN
ncbi:MAG: preprotein translocase subunit SecG [Bacteroidota bacterium]